MLRIAFVLSLSMTVAFSSACKKKKPKTPPTPTITLPAPQETPAPPTVTTTPEPPIPTTTTNPTPPAKAKPKHHARKPKPQPPVPQPTPPPAKSTTTNGSDAMTISPDLPKNELDSQKRATEQMLQTAEANLRKLNRDLSDGEKNMARQVRNYITQSRLATQDGDLERAHNLAVKAQLLSAELVK